MRRRGFDSLTCVTAPSAITEWDDFDVYRSRFERSGVLGVRLVDARFFAWTLRRGDVFIRFFDGGFLRPTPLQWLEAPLLRLAGKKLIVSPYGSDIAVAGHLGDIENALFTDYPVLRERSPETKRWVLHTSRWANLCVRHHQPGFLPRYDANLPNHFAIDLEEFSDDPSYSDADGSAEPVTVFHAPNHRNIKGTQYLIDAVDELQGEGLAVELDLVERRPNTKSRRCSRARTSPPTSSSPQATRCSRSRRWRQAGPCSTTSARCPTTCSAQTCSGHVRRSTRTRTVFGTNSGASSGTQF